MSLTIRRQVVTCGLYAATAGFVLCALSWQLTLRAHTTVIYREDCQTGQNSQKTANTYQSLGGAGGEGGGGGETRWRHHKQQPGSPRRIFYNRVEKCGSLAVITVIQALGEKNGFNYVKSTIYQERRVNQTEQATVARYINQEKGPFFFDRHLYFLNFSRFDEAWPTYINVVREPLDRMVSLYYYYRNGRVKFNRNNYASSKNVTFDECFGPQQNEAHCSRIQGDELMVFFCGQGSDCSVNHDRRTLAVAKSNVERHYKVVGLYEDLGSFFRVLETVSPGFFKGAEAQYASMNSTMYAGLSTYNKIPPSEETVKRFKEISAVEYEFYAFIKKRFYDQMLALGLISHN